MTELYFFDNKKILQQNYHASKIYWSVQISSKSHQTYFQDTGKYEHEVASRFNYPTVRFGFSFTWNITNMILEIKSLVIRAH